MHHHKCDLIGFAIANKDCPQWFKSTKIMSLDYSANKWPDSCDSREANVVVLKCCGRSRVCSGFVTYRRPLASIRATVERFVPGWGSIRAAVKNIQSPNLKGFSRVFFFFFSTTCNNGEECQQLFLKTWKLIILQIDLNLLYIYWLYKMAQLGSSVSIFKKNSGNFFSSVKYLTNCSFL
jgi:hypothetical protein